MARLAHASDDERAVVAEIYDAAAAVAAAMVRAEAPSPRVKDALLARASEPRPLLLDQGGRGRMAAGDGRQFPPGSSPSTPSVIPRWSSSGSGRESRTRLTSTPAPRSVTCSPETSQSRASRMEPATSIMPMPAAITDPFHRNTEPNSSSLSLPATTSVPSRGRADGSRAPLLDSRHRGSHHTAHLMAWGSN